MLVPPNVLDQTRASLALEGYPKNGFGYQVFTENTGLMTTDSDKDRYALYDLQNRIGATIMLFEGVKDAKVTIALGEQSKYVLTENELTESSAHVTVIMEDGGSPTPEMAVACRRLVASGVPGLDMDNVAVFDGNGNDVSNLDDGALSSKDTEEIAQVVEEQISTKVLNVLAPFYGAENVRISTKAQINMQTLLRETITYNTPEKINEEDKTGIISHENGSVEISGSKDAVANGVAGSETNADVPEYSTEDDDEDAEGYGARTYDRDFLVNQIKEQGQITPGALEDLTVSVAINGESFGTLTANDIRSLVGNAAGIAVTDWDNKISVVSAPFYQPMEEEEYEEETEGIFGKMASNPIFWVVFVVILVLLIVTVILLVLTNKRKKKRKAEEEAAAAEAAALAAAEAEQSSFINQELIDLQNDRGMELKKNLRDFTEENPEISAQLLKTWLNGGRKDGE